MINKSYIGNILIGVVLTVLIGSVIISQKISGNQNEQFITNSEGKNTVCALTRTDALGPFYEPGAPKKMITGSGELIIAGRVLSWPSCKPVRGSMIEFWQANKSGEYSKDQRATVIADDDGYFEYKSDFPGIYEFRPAHIHVKVTNQEIEELITQIYPKNDIPVEEINLDFVVLEKNADVPSGYKREAPLQPNR